MNQEISIAKAEPNDAEDLSRIKQCIWLNTYQNKEFGITAEDIFAKDFLCKERISKRAEHMSVVDGINYTLVAKVGPQIVGYGRAFKSKKINEIVTLYVIPKRQGQGIGSALLKDLLRWLGDHKAVRLGVVLYNEKAIRFYEKFGFKAGNLVCHDKPTFPSGRDLPELEMIREVTRK
jgi:GNAT superfamily N-acetyltransferase